MILNTEKEISYQDGMKTGRLNGIKETALAFLKNGVDIHIVFQATGLSLKQLQNLQRNV